MSVQTSKNFYGATSSGPGKPAHRRASFKSLFDTLADRFRRNPDSAITRFEVSSRQISGLHSEVEARDFLITVDEPKTLGGEDLGPNPVELVLAAIASCQEITYRLYADRLDIPLDGVSVTVKGDVDLNGLFSTDAGVRPGFRGVELDVELDSTAAPEELDRLKRTVDVCCPIMDVIRNATPVLARVHKPEPETPEIRSDQTFAFAGLAG